MQSLPLAQPIAIASKLERNMPAYLGESLHPGKTVGIIGRALGLSGALAKDGKGFHVSYEEG